MMDISREIQDVLTNIKLLAKESDESVCSTLKNPHSRYDFMTNNILDEIIDVNAMDFSNDEVWLCGVPNANSNVKDLKAWLYQDALALKDIDFHTKRLSLIREMKKTETKKSIDSRTFTRPKKRLSRPSIEMYSKNYFEEENNKYIDNESELHNISQFKLNESETSIAEITQIENTPLETDVVIENSTPLNFDLTQPARNIFDKVSGPVPELDSFQPPSLVNSLCSSTFANLMENSIIKNDPELREIRDANYTEADLHLPKSFTDSYGSINSDTPEGFLKHAADTINKSWKKDQLKIEDVSVNETINDITVLNCTYDKYSSSDKSSSDLCLNSGNTTSLQVVQQNTKSTDSNTTFTTTSHTVLNGTFKKTANYLNSTYQKVPEQHNDETITIVNPLDNHKLMKRRSYILDNNKESDLNHSTELKRNSIGFSAGSTDSLDYTSSLSNSSKGSNKMLNMAEIDAIVQQQERSLHVMSTPKPSSKIISKLFVNNCISPIPQLDRGDHLSDSETSSNEEYFTVASSASNITTVYGSETHLLDIKRSNSAANVPKPNPKSLNSIPTRVASNNKVDNNYKGSYTNLKTVNSHLKGSYTNLKPKGANVKGSYTNLTTATGGNIKGSYSNLKTMSNNLKGSYTQLKPVLTNLPCTDSNTIVRQPINPNLKKNSDGNLKIAEVAPTLRDISKGIAKSTSALNCPKLQQGKITALPRPISAIPRPATAVSRIPGPRTVRPTGLRPPSRPLSKVNFDGDF